MSGKARHLDDDDCLDLVHGLHDGATETVLLDHARACEECASRLLRCAGDLERLRARGPEARRRRRAGLAAPWFRPALAGGLALTALAAVWFLRGSPPAPPGGPSLVWLPDPSGLLVTRDAAEPSDRAGLEAGLRAYARRDAAAARGALERAAASGPEDLLRRAYLASAAAWLGDYAAAAAVLEATPVDALPEPWRSESRWVLAVAWRETGRSGDAIALLKDLARGEGAVAARARAALASEAP